MRRRDPLLDALARHVRENDRLADPRWDALAEGALPAEEQAELGGLVDRGEAPKLALEALRPLSDEEKEAIADRAWAEIQQRKAKKAPQPAPAPAKEEATKEAKGATVIPLSSRRRTLYGVATALSLAAAAALAIVVPSSGGALPSYAAFVEGGRSDERPYRPNADPKRAAIRLDPEARIHVTLRPEVGVEGALAARAFLVDRLEGRARPFEATIEPKPNGTLRISGIRRELFADAPNAEHELVFVIARPDALPSDAEIAQKLERREELGRGVQAISVPVILTGGS